MNAQQYNDDFAWRNGFGGGLPEGYYKPDTQEFINLTRAIQRRCKLDIDGYFGPNTFEAYKRLHSEPSLQVLGIDVSGHQLPSELSMADMKRLGRDVVGIKLVQGVGGRSRHCEGHTTNAVEAGLRFFYYIFCSPWTGSETTFVDDSVAEAEHAVDMLSRNRDDGLLAAVDFENKGYKQKKEKDPNTGKKVKLDICEYGQAMFDLWENRRGGGRAEYIQRMTDWIGRYLHRFVELYGAYPMLYTYPGFVKDRIDLDAVDEILFKCPLWLASHTLGNPMVRHKMDKRFNLVLHQYSSDGDAETRAVFDHGLDLNRAPYGIEPLLRSVQ